MSRYSIICRIAAVAGLLAFGTQPGRADADVDGMDHSKLNHGVAGQAPHQEVAAHEGMPAHHEMHEGHAAAAGAAAAAPAPAPATAAAVAGLDPDVAGMDHSKLNHGVLGFTWKSPGR